MQWRADPLADDTIAKILGSWPTVISAHGTDAATTLAAYAVKWQRIREANKLIATWVDNARLVHWNAGIGASPEVALPLADYIAAARVLPEWANAAHISRAETIFIEHGVLSCLLLFCASLPECYVVPDLSDVLHAAGQLENHTQHRIRSTAAMIFPVMMRGGLTSPEGAGVAQVLKVRLIHAMIRNLILHGEPVSVVNALATNFDIANDFTGVIAPLLRGDAPTRSDLFQTLFAHGWHLRRDALPCNQEELGYTLLTFNYIFLRGLRTLRLALTPEDEAAYLHTWNVMAHVLGVEHSLMPATMTEAEKLFCEMQARGRADSAKRPTADDPRPKLGQALMKCMEDVIPFAVFKGFPTLLTTRLCGREVAKDIGILSRSTVTIPSRILFTLIMFIVGFIDGVMRLLMPQFSLSRMLSRAMGYHLICKLMLDQTRPLKLPRHLENQMNGLISGWSNDPKAAAWVNTIEDWFTTRGDWYAMGVLSQRKVSQTKPNGEKT